MSPDKERLILGQLIASAAGVDAVKPETTMDSLNLDSLEFLQLVKDIESEFSIKISDEQIVKLNTVGDFEQLLQVVQ